MSKLAALLLGLSAVCAFPSAHGAELTTMFHDTNSWNGNMFDVVISNSPLTVTALSINLYPGTTPVSVYIKNGTWVGSENSAGAWTLVDTVVATSAGSNVPTFLDIKDFTLSASTTYGVYITTTDPAINLAYTASNSPIGSVAASNTDLKILVGTGNAYAFSDNIAPRIWNGTIQYSITAVPEPETYAMFLGGLSLLAMMGRRRIRQS